MGDTATGMEAAVAPRTAAEVPAERSGRPVGRPLVDPPEFGDRVRDTDRQPFWIPGAFPTIFQNETGDPYAAPKKEVDLVLWASLCFSRHQHKIGPKASALPSA